MPKFDKKALRNWPNELHFAKSGHPECGSKNSGDLEIINELLSAT